MSIVRLIQSEEPEPVDEQLEVGKDVVIRKHNRRTEVTLDFSGPCSYTFATRIDEDWMRIVTALADFRSGPVTVTSAGEDYEESGPLIWQIGPERRVLTSGIRKRKAEIRRLQGEIVALERRQMKAIERIVILER
jgi:hypothetical protein